MLHVRVFADPCHAATGGTGAELGVGSMGNLLSPFHAAFPMLMSPGMAFTPGGVEVRWRYHALRTARVCMCRQASVVP
jgi:hypothetical protein